MKAGRSQLIYLSLVVTTLYFSLIQSFVTPLMPYFMSEFGIDQGAVTWLITGYLLTAAIATPFIGKMGDIFGKARMFRVTMVIFTFGSLLAAVSDSFWMLLTARMIQGIGGAIFPLAFGIIRDDFPREKVPGAIGQLSSIMAIGGGIGILAVGPVLDVFGYRSLFWGAGIMGLLATVMAFWFIPITNKIRGAKLDWPGTALLIVWLSLLLLGVTEGNTLGWFSWQVLSMIGAGLLLLTVWIFVETKVEFPLINMRTMRNPTVLWGNVVAFLFGGVMFSSGIFIVSLLQVPKSSGYGIGATVTETGIMMLPQTVCFFLVGYFAGWVSRVLTPRGAVLIGALFSAAGFLLMAMFHETAVMIITFSCVAGIGSALIFSQITNVILDAVPTSETGSITGMNTNIRNIGGSIFSQISAAVVVIYTVDKMPEVIGYQIVFLIFVALSVLAFFACLAIPRHKEFQALSDD